MSTQHHQVPALRFPEFVQKWESKTLIEIGEFKNGINKSKEDFGFGFPFVNLMNVFGKSSIYNAPLDLVNVTGKELKLYELKKGDVLFIRSSVKKEGVGETSLILEDLINTVYSGFLIRFRDNIISIDLHFKKYCFWTKKFRNSLISLSSTSANTNINQDSLSSLEVALPSLPEQQKIASFLTAIDAKIVLLTKKKTLLEQYKKGVMQQLFSQKIRFKDDRGEDYPDWEVKPLGELGQKFLNGGTPPTTVIEYWQGDIPWITGADFLNQEVGNVRRFINQKAVSNSSTNIVAKGWLLIVTRTGVGKMAIAPYDVAISQDITGIQLRKELVLTEYLFSYLSFKQQDLINQNQGTSINGIKRNDLLNIQVQIPSLMEQHKIASFLSSIDKKISSSQNQIEGSKTYKKGLMQQLFI